MFAPWLHPCHVHIEHDGGNMKGERLSGAEVESERRVECVRGGGAPAEAGIPAVNAVRLVVGGGRLPGFSVTGVRVQAGSGRRLGRHVPRAATPP